MRITTRGLALGLLVLASACASVERDPEWAKRVLADTPEVVRFDVPESLQLGFDEPDPDAVWHRGDRVLYGVRLVTEDGERTWFVRFTLEELPPDRQNVCPEARVSNADLTVGGWSNDGVYATYKVYRNEVWHKVEVFDGDGTPRRSRDYREASYAYVVESQIASLFAETVSSVVRMIRNVPELDAILMKAIDPPSLWSVIRYGGVSLSASIDPGEGAKGSMKLYDGKSVETLRLPVPLNANGTPCLDAIVEFTWKRSPLLLCHGVVGVDARHPSNPKRRVLIRLLGARRGG